MYVKLCDNCNDIAAVGDQNCIELKFTYGRETKHFCGKECLNKYLNEHDEYERLLYDIKEKIIETLGKEKIDDINKIVNNIKKDDYNYGKRYSERILREEIVNMILIDIIRDDE